MAFWDDVAGTIVLYDPTGPDGGTVFRPPSGKEFFEGDDLWRDKP